MISDRFFFEPNVGAWGVFLDSALMHDSFLTYVHFQDIECIHLYIFQNHPAPHPTTPSPPQTDRGKLAYFFPRLIFPFSRSICFKFQSLVMFSGLMHVICIRNFVTDTGWMETSIKVTYADNSRTLSNEILWYLRSPNSNNRSSRFCIVLPEITSKLTFQCLSQKALSNLIFSLSRAVAV